MSGQRIIVNHSDGSNTFLNLVELSRLYCAYGNNTAITSVNQNEWTRFTYPSGGFTTYRVKDFEIHPTMCRFTYIGSTPKWINISVVCNLLKANGNQTSRDLEVQWYHNSNPTGVVRRSHMSTQDAQIISGNGQLYLSNGDHIEPWIRNTENGDDFQIFNCSFDLKEDAQYAFVI
jgi:hypothetical protein